MNGEVMIGGLCADKEGPVFNTIVAACFLRRLSLSDRKNLISAEGKKRYIQQSIGRVKMSVLSFIGFPFIFILSSVWGEQTLTYSCKNASNTVSITLNNRAGNEFIIVPGCNDSSSAGNTFTLSHCLESFTNGMQTGYLFHETGNISKVRTFTINCQNGSDGNATVSDIVRNITINTLPPQYICDFNMTIVEGNKGYYLGQEIKVILTAAGPYSITPVKCIASSSVNPNISIVLWENGTTQRQYLLRNFSGSCNNTLTATMYGFRFVHSTSVSLTCAVKPCGEHQCREPSDTEDAVVPDDARYSEDEDYLSLLSQPTIEHTVTVKII